MSWNADANTYCNAGTHPDTNTDADTNTNTNATADTHTYAGTVHANPDYYRRRPFPRWSGFLYGNPRTRHGHRRSR